MEKQASIGLDRRIIALSNLVSEIDSEKYDGRCEAGHEYCGYEKKRDEFVFLVEVFEIASLHEGDAGKGKEHEGAQGERYVKCSFHEVIFLSQERSSSG